LSIWVTGFKAITGSYFTRINLKVSCFEINRHNIAMIALFDLRSYLRLIERIAPLGKLFLAISGLSNCHRFDLATNRPFILAWSGVRIASPPASRELVLGFAMLCPTYKMVINRRLTKLSKFARLFLNTDWEAKMMMKYELIIYWSEEDQAFVVEVPALPGCAADGNTYVEALENAQIVMQEWIETAQELGRLIPQPRGKLVYA
jgi:predicted RNase H-like HicB family nuclease